MHKLRPLLPGDLLHFVELDEFTTDWESLGFDVERDLWDLQSIIMSNPQGGPVIPATGGIRKLRFGKAEENIGKSGGIRVLYAYFPNYWMVLLIMAYEKNRKDNLTPTEKSALKEYLGRVDQWLRERKS
jgi:hypothetical protein